MRQWSPRVKKFIVAEKDYMTNGHIEHIVKASDDGIPNIFSPDDIFLQEGVRQSVVSAKRLAEFVDLGEGAWRACRNDIEKRNWHRNSTLIDFQFIPDDIKNSIVEQYLNTTPMNDKMKIFNYLVKHRCRLLLDEIESF